MFDKIKKFFMDPYDVAEIEIWADNELERLAEGLIVKRAKAIEYLGDKWILKGAAYSRSNSVLGEK